MVGLFRRIGVGVSPRTMASIWISLLLLGPFLAHFVSGAPSSIPLLAELEKFASNAIPSINILAAASSFPETTKLFMTIQWLFVSPFVAVCLCLVRTDSEQEKDVKIDWWVRLLSPVVSFAVFWWWFSLPWIDIDDIGGSLENSTLLDQIIILMCESKIWLGLYGSAGCLVSTTGLCMAIFKMPILVRPS